jgi:hypothetical protein
LKTNHLATLAIEPAIKKKQVNPFPKKKQVNQFPKKTNLQFSSKNEQTVVWASKRPPTFSAILSFF